MDVTKCSGREICHVLMLVQVKYFTYILTSTTSMDAPADRLYLHDQIGCHSIEIQNKFWKCVWPMASSVWEVWEQEATLYQKWPVVEFCNRFRVTFKLKFIWSMSVIFICFQQAWQTLQVKQSFTSLQCLHASPGRHGSAASIGNQKKGFGDNAWVRVNQDDLLQDILWQVV